MNVKERPQSGIPHNRGSYHHQKNFTQGEKTLEHGKFKQKPRFWKVRNGNKVNISPGRFFEYLEFHGIRKYYLDKRRRDKEAILIKLTNNRAFPITIDYLSGRIITDLKNQNVSWQVIDAVYQKLDSLLSKIKVSTLSSFDGKFFTDTKNKAFFFFKNGGYKVTKEGIDIIDYNDLNECIWQSQVIDHEIDLKSFEEVKEKAIFYKFYTDITRIEGDSEWSEKRFNHLFSINGFLLHSYKDQSRPAAVILQDADNTENPNGGTGKSLIGYSLGKLRKLTPEDGKNFSWSSRFLFQQVEPDTKILLIDDVGNNFKIEKLFPAISEGITVEKKYQDRYTIPFHKSPKILITTNYALRGVGSSYARRMYEFELSNYFSDKYTPIEEYGHMFFYDWNKEQWDLFYSLMIYACQFYLKNGIVESMPVNIEYNKLVAETSPEFVDYVMNNIKLDIKYHKTEKFNEFQDIYPDYKFMKQNTFTKWLKIYAQLKNLDWNDLLHSGYDYYFLLTKKSQNTLF